MPRKPINGPKHLNCSIRIFSSSHAAVRFSFVTPLSYPVIQQSLALTLTRACKQKPDMQTGTMSC
jgi:hypothetical protein